MLLCVIDQNQVLRRLIPFHIKPQLTNMLFVSQSEADGEGIMNWRRDLLAAKHTPSHVERPLAQDSLYSLLAKKTARLVAVVVGKDTLLRICSSIDEFPAQRRGET